MSFDINWDQLVEDDSINESIKEFLDYQFRNLTLPSYIDSLSVTNFSLGTQSPEIIIRHIGDPFEDFYEDEEEDGDQPRTVSQTIPNDYDSSDEDEDDEDDEDDDDEDDESQELTSISEDSNLTSTSPKKTKLSPTAPAPTTPPALNNGSRTSSDSISLIIGNGNLNYLQNYNMNSIVGLGNLNNANTHNGTETPTNIFSQNPLRNNSSSFLKNRITPKGKSTSRNENDIQLIIEINYHGDLHLEVTVNLLVNYPSPKFISLPIKLHITDLVVHSIAAVAYLKKSVYFSFLCDINDAISDYFTSLNAESYSNSNPSTTGGSVANTGGNFVDYITSPNNRERIDIIKKVRIESEIGEIENNVLRNVGKVERFLVEQLRRIIRDEIAWPSWVCFDLNEEDDYQDDDDTNEDNGDT